MIRRRFARRRVTVATGLALIALVASACTGNGSSSNGSGKTLTVGLSAAMNSLNPLPSGAKNFYLFNLMYDTPVVMHGKTPAPALVTSWKFGAGSRSLTLTLRKNVTYSDGTPFDASALVWNIDWEKKPATGSSALGLWQHVTAEAVGKNSVRLTFDRPMPAILGMLSGAPMVKPNAPNSGIGTGPFKVKKYVPGQSLSAVRNSRYWQPGEPHIDEIDFKNYSEPTTATLALRSGTVDMLLLPDSTQLKSLKSAGDKFLAGPSSADGYLPIGLYSLLINTTDPQLKNPLVRQALSLAFDRKHFISAALAGAGEPADNVFSPSSPAYQAGPQVASFDLARASSLLKQAGVSKLNIEVDAVNVLPQTKFMPVYQQDLAKIGVTLKIHQVDAVTWATLAASGNFPQVLTQLAGFSYLDPAIAFGTPNLEAANNSEHFSSPQYASLVQRAGKEVDARKRADDYKAVGSFLQQQSFYIPLAYATSSAAAAYSPRVGDVTVRLGGGAQTPDYAAITLQK